MTNADAGFFAKHIEKMILGVGLVVLLVIAVLFLLRDPYRIELRDVNGRMVTVGPTSVEGVVKGAIDELDNRLTANRTGFDEPRIPNYAADLSATSSRTPLAVASFAQWGPPGTTVAGDGSQITGQAWILPNVPMPLSVVASSDYGLIRFEDVPSPQLAEGIRRVIGNQVPADVRYVSAAARFDMDAWSQRFERIPLEQRVPDILYRNSLFITGVYLQRQTLDPITRRWGQTTTIKPLDGMVHFIPESSRRFDRDAGDNAVRQVKLNQQEITRAPFPPLDPIRPWRAPDDAGAQLTPEQRQEINNLNRRIDALERRIEAHRRRFRLDAPEQPGVRQPGGVRPGSERFDPDEFMDAPRQPVRPAPGGTRPATGARDPQAQLTEMLTEVEGLKRQREAIRLGVTPDELINMRPGGMQDDFIDGHEFMDPGMMGPGQPGTPRQYGGQIEVLAHDLTVEPGRTYRYKVVVTVLNPLFQNRQLQPEQVEQNLHRISLEPNQLEIDAAEWSAPVEVEPRFEFFAINSNNVNQSVDVEVYTIFNGARQVERFSVQAGDPIGQMVTRSLPGGTVHNIDMRVGAVMVDLVSAPGSAGMASARMLYLEPRTNRIAVRDVAQDRNSVRKRDLEFEVNEAAQAAQAAAQARADDLVR